MGDRMVPSPSPLGRRDRPRLGDDEMLLLDAPKLQPSLEPSLFCSVARLGLQLDMLRLLLVACSSVFDASFKRM